VEISEVLAELVEGAVVFWVVVRYDVRHVEGKTMGDYLSLRSRGSTPCSSWLKVKMNNKMEFLIESVSRDLCLK
jgi:hypothetical protein